jgi:hypothetical protein
VIVGGVPEPVFDHVPVEDRYTCEGRVAASVADIVRSATIQVSALLIPEFWERPDWPLAAENGKADARSEIINEREGENGARFHLLRKT